MWNIQILGFDLYLIAAWFWIYSFMGWIWETSFVSVLQKKFVNRGFVNGPVLTIYGFGAVILYLILNPISENLYLLYLGGVVFATLLEYITAFLMEKFFHASWWDYSGKLFNFQGKICLESSVAWGFFTLILFYVLHPFVTKIVDFVPHTLGEFIISAVTVVYSGDFSISLLSALKLKERLQNIEDTKEEFMKYLQNSKLGEITEEFKTLSERFKHELSNKKADSHLLAFKERLSEYSKSHADKKEELLSYFENFSSKYLSQRKNMDKVTKRYINAYPNLKMHKKRRFTKK